MLHDGEMAGPDLQSCRCLARAEVGEEPQREHDLVALPERAERRHQFGVDVGRRPVTERWRVATGGELLPTSTSFLRPEVAGDLVGGDPHQPRTQGVPTWFERRERPPTALEGRGGDVVGERVAAEPAAHEPMDVTDMAAKEDGEGLRLLPGADHERRVVEILDRRDARPVGAPVRGQSRATSADTSVRLGIRTVSGRLRATIRSLDDVAITA